MTRELYLIRHGRTLFNEKRIIQGWCDSPLTSEGVAMAQRVGRYFERERIAFDHAYTSTLTRTQQTMACITDMPFECLDGLREWGFGAFEAERVSLMPPFPWGDFYVPFGGESQLQVRERVCDTLAALMERPGHERVIAVSHGSACREFLTRWGGDERFATGGVPGNCSIMRFTYERGAFALERIIEQDELHALLGE